MEDPHLQNPGCPNCKKQLSKVISPRVLTSYPPYVCYACDCGFQGYVKLEFSPEGVIFNEETKYMPRKFSNGKHILNDEWLVNLKNKLEKDD
jgi:hypothetical protein